MNWFLWKYTGLTRKVKVVSKHNFFQSDNLATLNLKFSPETGWLLRNWADLLSGVGK